MNRKLFDVAVTLLREDGWEALNLDRIAERAGVSRATVWRHGITRASVEQQLRLQLAADYRDLLWPSWRCRAPVPSGSRLVSPHCASWPIGIWRC
jgi:AcrR family transcriptional regulator